MADDTKLQALLDLIAPEDEENYLKVAIYGDPGVGKTVFAATAPKPLFLDVENGYISVKNHPELYAESKRMKFVGVQAVEVFAEKILEGAFDEYSTIVIDTLTALQERSLKEHTISAYRKSPGSRDDPYTPEGKDYQRNTEKLKHIISLFRDADKHVIFLCHTKEEKDERTGVILKRPMLTPKLASKLAADCSIVGVMTQSGGQNGEPVTRYMQVSPNSTTVAKSRIAGLPATLKNPTFDMFLHPENYFHESGEN